MKEDSEASDETAALADILISVLWDSCAEIPATLFLDSRPTKLQGDKTVGFLKIVFF